MTQTIPKITVIIPTFNRAVYLAQCLDGILRQTVPAHQIIVVNNGSKDDTQKLCRSYADKIEYYEMEQIGKAGAVNFGFKKVTGDYIWIFDDDDIALEDALERFVEPLKDNPNLSFSFSPIFYTATNIETNKMGNIIYESKIPDLNRGVLIALLEENFIGGAAIFARTSCYKVVGDFSVDLLRSQDYEMAIRIARQFKGARVRGGATYYLRQHEGLRGPTSDRFMPIHNKEKWLKYDQSIFKELYQSLSLSDYLPPEYILDSKIRQAILQRMSIMASKGLFLESTQDLRLLASFPDRAPFSREEYTIVRAMIVNKPYYNSAILFDYKPFFDEVRHLAKTSYVIRLLRFNIMWAIGARFKNQPKFNEIYKSLNRLVRLNI